jgi:hypothetical protein
MYVFSTSFIPSNAAEFQGTKPDWPCVPREQTLSGRFLFLSKKSQTWSWIFISSPFLLLIWDTSLFSTVFSALWYQNHSEISMFCPLWWHRESRA